MLILLSSIQSGFQAFQIEAINLGRGAVIRALHFQYWRKPKAMWSTVWPMKAARKGKMLSAARRFLEKSKSQYIFLIRSRCIGVRLLKKVSPTLLPSKTLPQIVLDTESNGVRGMIAALISAA